MRKMNNLTDKAIDAAIENRTTNIVLIVEALMDRRKYKRKTKDRRTDKEARSEWVLNKLKNERR